MIKKGQSVHKTGNNRKSEENTIIGDIKADRQKKREKRGGTRIKKITFYTGRRHKNREIFFF